MANILSPKNILNPSGTFGISPSSLSPQEDSLQKNLDALARLQLQAQALGIKDTTGTGPMGFLTGALGYLARPLNASQGFLTGITGIGLPGEEQNPLKRALQGLQGQNFSLGNYIQAPEGASALQRGLLGTALFGADVLTDPLTYVGGKGFEALGRAGAAATEAEVTRAATKVLKPVARTPQVTSPIATALGTSTDVAKQAARDKIDLIKPNAIVRPGADLSSPSLLSPTIGTESAIAKTQLIKPPSFQEAIPPVPLVEPITSTVSREVDPFVKQLAENAAGAKISTGSVGARRSIENDLRATGNYTEDQVQNITKEILKNTSEITTGGIGLKIPGVGRDMEGNIAFGGNRTSKMLIKTPGAGYGLDSQALNDITQSLRGFVNSKVRSTGMVSAISSALNGQFGEEYANVIKNAATQGARGYDYSTFKKIVGASEAEKQLFRHMDHTSISVLESGRNLLDKTSNKEEALKEFNTFYNLGPDAPLPINATPDQKIAHDTAMTLHSYVNGTRADAVLAGSRTGTNVNIALDRKAGRILSPEEIAWQKARGEKITDYNPNAQRRILSEIDPVTGQSDSLSNNAVNDLYVTSGLRPAGHRVFETDGFKIAAAEIASNTKTTTMLNYIGDLLDTGLFTEGKQQVVNLLDTASTAKKLNSRMATIGNKLQKLYDNAATNGSEEGMKAIDDLLVKLSTNKETINGILSGINPLDPEAFKKIGSIMDIYQSVLNDFKATTGKTLFTDKQIKNLMSTKGFTIKRDTLENLKDTVEVNLAPLGIEGRVNVPKQLTNMFADESVAKSVERYFKVQSSKTTDLQKIVDNFYSPYYTLFKTWATIGRGLGYHFKNITGALWNNDLGGVGATDHAQSGIVLSQAKIARSKASKAIDSLLTNGESGLTGDAHVLAKYIADVSQFQGIPVSDLYKQQLADYILFDKLKTVKVGQHTMADVYAAATDNGMFRDNRRMESLRNDARQSGGELIDHLTDPKYINLFKGYSKSQLNTAQNVLNFIANPKYKAIKPLEWSANIAEASENYVRLAAFIQGARRYGVNDGGTAASLFAKSLQFDYADLSDFERNVMKNIIPFYTWTRKNVPLQFSSIFTQPGKFNRLTSASNEMENAFAVDQGEGQLANIVPSFMRDRMGFVSNLSFAGSPIVLGIETPAMDLNRFIPFGSVGGLSNDVTKQIAGSLNPLAKVSIEALTGTSTFTGAKFSPTGTASPTGTSLPFGLTNLDKNGNPVVSAQGYNALSGLIPIVGNVAKTLPLLGLLNPNIPTSDTNKGRLATNLASMWLGAPFSTLDTKQATGEILNRKTNLQNEINQMVNNNQIDKDWLNQMIKYNTPIEVIKASIDAGLGRRPIQ